MLTLRHLQSSDEEAISGQPDETIEFFFIGREHVESFGDYCEIQKQWEQGENLPKGFVRSVFLVGIVDGEIIGRVSIRLELNDFLRKIGGHIGYLTFPDFEGRGYATQMLSQALEILRQTGIPSALVTCSQDNLASRRVIEKCGGVYQGTITCEVENDIVQHFHIAL